MPQPFSFDDLVREQLKLVPPPSGGGLDCFVSSEVGYNEVIARCAPATDRAGGAYLGVGADQNFTYIGALRPSLAVILDARLDNLLEHLIFKLAFAKARDPLDYLCLLFGRTRATGPGPAICDRLRAQPIDGDAAEAFSDHVRRAFRARWTDDERLLRRVTRLLTEFVRRQLAVTSVSETCLAHLDKIPDFEEVITSTTPEGFNFHYLTDAGRFAYVKALHAEDRIVPLLGNVEGPEGTAAARRIIEWAGLKLTTVYLSNLEELLLQRYVIEDDRITRRPNPAGLFDGAPGHAYEALIDRLAALPCDDDAVLIRFFFPALHRGRQLGVFPWLAPHVTFLDTFLRRFRAEGPACVLDTYA